MKFDGTFSELHLVVVNLRLGLSKEQLDSILQSIGAAVGVDVSGGATPSP